MDKITPDLTRYQKESKGHLEKGREPINEREKILTDVAKLTGTEIRRWCRYPVSVLTRALVAYSEVDKSDGHIRNKAAYFTYLVRLSVKQST